MFFFLNFNIFFWPLGHIGRRTDREKSTRLCLVRFNEIHDRRNISVSPEYTRLTSSKYIRIYSWKPLYKFKYIYAHCTYIYNWTNCIKGNDVESLSWLPVVSLMVFIFSFAIGFGPLPWVLNSELFAKEAKVKAGF